MCFFSVSFQNLCDVFPHPQRLPIKTRWFFQRKNDNEEGLEHIKQWNSVHLLSEDATWTKHDDRGGTLGVFSPFFRHAESLPGFFKRKSYEKKQIYSARCTPQKGKSQLQKRIYIYISMTCCKASKTTIGFLLVSIFALPSVFSLQKISKNGAFEVMKAAQAGTPENLWPSLGWRIFLLPCFCKVFLIILHDLVKPDFFFEKKDGLHVLYCSCHLGWKKTIIHSF